MKLKYLFLFCYLAGLVPLTTYAQDTKPWVLWYWMQGGYSKEGIRADLEAMKEVGIGGAYLMPIKGITTPPVYTPATTQLSDKWWELVKFSVQEADRLGLKIGMHLSDGFSLAGGPWITPELSMQKLVFSKVWVSGGKKVKISLPQPKAKENYYKDVAVYAFPSPTGSGISTQTIVPRVSTSTGVDASFLVKEGNSEAFRSNDAAWIKYSFEKPFTARTIFIQTNGNNVQAHRLIIESSDDGQTWKRITRLQPPRHGWQDTDEDVTHSIPPTTSRFFRFVYDKEGSEPGSEDLDNAKWKPSLKLVKLELSSSATIHHFEGKSGAVWRVSPRTSEQQISKDLCVPLKNIINLSDKLNADNSLNWTPPTGDWTIIRIGHTSTGHRNETGGAAKGLECDKFNPEATKLQFNSWFNEALKQVGPTLAPRVLNTFHMDSWECGSQNWSVLFRDEFIKRRGYDPLPYLPTMAGIPLEDIHTSEKFLYDMRKTIAELVVDNFYKTLAGLAKEKGVVFSGETVAPTMLSDGLAHFKLLDQPMGEYWLNSPTHDKPNDMLDAISGAHIYGKNIIGVEAFTTVRMAWNEHPGMLKTLQDRNYALGINKISYHVFAHNPWLDRKPGMTLDGVGLYFQRDQTWWKPGKAWVDYAERCHEMLQKGSPVVDIAVFAGEELPNRAVLPDRLVPVLPGLFGKDVVETEAKRLANVGEPMRQIPAGVTNSANMADPENWVNPLRGYAYDSFNSDALATATVKNGAVVFESGASYKLLVIPGKLALNPNSQYMSIAVVKKLLELLKQGAVMQMMEKPLEQPGLQAVENSAFQQVVNELWNGTYTGKLIKGAYQNETLNEIGLQRDLIAQEPNGTYAKKIAYTHRKEDEGDIYFISNQDDKERQLNLSFRSSAGSIELYDAVSNLKWEAKNFRTENERTIVPVKLAANASVFVIFKNAVTSSVAHGGRNWKEYNVFTSISQPWMVQFDTGFGGPKNAVEFKTLSDWSTHQDSLIKYYSGTAVYSTSLKLKNKPEKATYLDLGEVANIAEVSVNDIPCGTAWTYPYRVNISKAIKKGDNKITVAVTNTWANRLMGDHRLPESKRITQTTAPYRLEGAPLQKAGLLGEVKILEEE